MKYDVAIRNEAKRRDIFLLIPDTKKNKFSKKAKTIPIRIIVSKCKPKLIELRIYPPRELVEAINQLFYLLGDNLYRQDHHREHQ